MTVTATTVAAMKVTPMSAMDAPTTAAPVIVTPTTFAPMTVTPTVAPTTVTPSTVTPTTGAATAYQTVSSGTNAIPYPLLLPVDCCSLHFSCAVATVATVHHVFVINADTALAPLLHSIADAAVASPLDCCLPMPLLPGWCRAVHNVDACVSSHWLLSMVFWHSDCRCCVAVLPMLCRQHCHRPLNDTFDNP